MTGLLFDSVYGKGTYPTLWEGYLPIIGLCFDSVFGTGTYPTLWDGYLGRVLTPPCGKGTYPTLCWNQHCLSVLNLVLLLPQLPCSLIMC